MKHNQMRQVVFPILAAFIWGTAFVAQDVCADSMGAFTFNATRYFIAVLALLVLIVIMDATKKNKPQLTPEEKKASRKKLWLGGFCCGTALAVASNFQQAGMVARHRQRQGRLHHRPVCGAGAPVRSVFQAQDQSPRVDRRGAVRGSAVPAVH